MDNDNYSITRLTRNGWDRKILFELAEFRVSRVLLKIAFYPEVGLYMSHTHFWGGRITLLQSYVPVIQVYCFILQCITQSIISSIVIPTDVCVLKADKPCFLTFFRNQTIFSYFDFELAELCSS